MEDSKAATDPGDMDRHQKIIEFLMEQASLALEGALEKKMPIVEAMRGDEVFLGRLVDRVIERLDAREADRQAKLDRELDDYLQALRGAKSDEERLAIIEKFNGGSTGVSKTRWGLASAKVGGE
ncbi:hypothetical protein [Ectopseudomonas toyotomiensis]|uniref:Uncharacterized protein n=1 Tax=Ectopseudomonas toyotomiensis TaxID=554344 RepID=A0AA42LFD8_9GAMM|nr:hypothetical protein [Pseudomonas toyotomiensis]MBG0839023.1 hypothetical protein [Pseudomonas toyotomiensis]MDH0699902.1 hypothetical protein [Pseudomonas toyotomiensis]